MKFFLGLLLLVGSLFLDLLGGMLLSGSQKKKK